MKLPGTHRTRAAAQYRVELCVVICLGLKEEAKQIKSKKESVNVKGRIASRSSKWTTNTTTTIHRN